MTLILYLMIDYLYLLFVNSGIQSFRESSGSALVVQCFTPLAWIGCSMVVLIWKIRRFLSIVAFELDFT